MKAKNPKRFDFESGSTEALMLAFVTLLRMQPADIKARFISAYPLNVKTWTETALFSTAPDDWIEGIDTASAQIQRLVLSEEPNLPAQKSAQ